MDPLIVAVAGSSALSLASILVAVYRRRTVVTSQLQVELDLAVEQNKRLTAELAGVRDELHSATLKLTPEKLGEHAKLAVAYANQIGGTNEEKLRHALGASILSDKGANGRQDWTDAQHRIAIEAELKRTK